MKNDKEKNLTGMPHIDKPWMKYYSESAKNIVTPNVNILDYLKMKNKNNLGSVAEVYYGLEFTYDELFYNSELAAKSLKEAGVKKGEVVANLVSNIPEAGQIWFGATDIGAISDFIDPRPDGMNPKANAEKILGVLKDESVSKIVALDFSYLFMLKPIENELKDLGIDTIILVSADDSMTKKGRLDYLKDVIEYNKLENSRTTREKINNYKALANKLKMERKIQDELKRAIETSPLRIIKYKDLTRECDNVKYDKVSDGNLVNYIGHTSGTTAGKPKPIEHTNNSGIALSEQCSKAHFSPERGEKSFHLLPFFAPAGAYSNYLNSLANGVTTIDVSEFHIGDFGYLIKKYHPNYVLATPTWLSLLPNYKLLEKEDLSYLRKMIYVGESISLKDKRKISKWLKEHNSNATLSTAHGMSEIGGCGTYAFGEYDKENSIGIPLPNTTYGVVDPNIEDRLVPLKFEGNEAYLEGELVVSCPNLTTGMLGDKTIIPKYEMDGKYYIRTKDLVKMDRDGVFYFNDRKDRSFCRVDGYKIKPYEIENVIQSNKYVDNVKIASYYDERKNGYMPKCFITLKEDYEESRIDIVKDIVYNTIIANPYMSSRQIPSKFKFIKSFPVTKNNKIDFKALNCDGLDGIEISVDVEETNLSVGNIDIYSDSKVLKKNKK